METFSELLAICTGNSPVPGEFPAQRPVTQSFDVFFDLRLNNRLSKQSWDGDLRRYRAHYDVIVIVITACNGSCQNDKGQNHTFVIPNSQELPRLIKKRKRLYTLSEIL